MHQAVLELVKSCVTELNEELEYESLRNINEETPIFGSTDGIDSLSLVRLISEVESAVNQKFGSNILLADEKAMSMRNSPYRNVGALVDFIQAKLGEK